MSQDKDRQLLKLLGLIEKLKACGLSETNSYINFLEKRARGLAKECLVSKEPTFQTEGGNMGASKGRRITIKSVHTGKQWEGTVISTYWYHPGNGYGYSHEVYVVETDGGGTMHVRVGRDGGFVKEDNDKSYQ